MSTGALAILVAVYATGLLGWGGAGYPGAAAGLAAGLLVGVVRWRGRPPWSWLLLWLRAAAPIVLADPVTVANDRSGGGVRYQDGVAAVAVQLLGKPHTPTLFTGSTATRTDNTVDIAELAPLLHQSLGLTLESLSVISVGARRRSTGDYPRVYDTLIGTPPYAGRRETWIIARLDVVANLEALRHRVSVGAAALAAAQRISAALRRQGVRARVATATDIVELERRLGAAGLAAPNRRWGAVRSETGWLCSYGYRSRVITADLLAQAWSLRADGIITNVTLFADRTATVVLTVRGAHPPAVPPSVLLQPLPGEQALALAGHCCGPRPELRGIRRGVLAPPTRLPVGPSGVLLGKVEAGNRLLLPLDDPGEFSRVHLAAGDDLAKRIVVRLAGSGQRVTVHTGEPLRWAGVRMPDVVVTDGVRPAAGSTVSVLDGTAAPSPRPGTVISLGRPDAPDPPNADVIIRQTGPATLQVTTPTGAHRVEMELFRAENRYAAAEPEPVK